MNNREVAHLWANQSKDHAKGSNFFFRDRAIFSYGHHFKIAEHVKDHPGHVFFTRRDYSISTTRHKSYVRQAIGSHLKTWLVKDFILHSENVKAYIEDMETARTKALKARTNADYYRDEAISAAIKAGEYAQEFGTSGDKALKRKALKLANMARSGDLFSPEELAGVRERVRAAREANRAIAKKREAEIAKAKLEAMEQLNAWARNEPGAYVPGSYYSLGLPTVLRLEEDGRRVVTSRGAQITTRTARMLWTALCKGVNVVGQNLDGYNVRSWDGSTLTVGCHTIAASELVRIAGILGLPGSLPVVAEVK